MTNLKVDLRVGETLKFNDGQIVVTLLEKSGQRARLDVRAEQDVKITTPRTRQAADVAKSGLTVRS